MFRTGPGFLSALRNQLEKFSYEELQKTDRAGGLDVHDLINLILKPRDHSVDMPDYVGKKELVEYQAIKENILQLGEEAIVSGKVAFCIFLGDRNIENTPCGLLKVPDIDMSLLSIKVLQSLEARHIWVVTNPDDRNAAAEHLSSLSGCEKIELIDQFLTFGLTPDNQISLSGDKPLFVPCGTGDLISSLKDSNLMKNFVDQGGQYIFVVNSSNIFAHLDPALVGQHIASKKQVTCEVVEREKNEEGNLLCNNAGILQIVDQKRMSFETNFDNLLFLSTGTMIFNVDCDFSLLKWRWNRSRTIMDSKIVDHYERSLFDITEVFETQYILSDRNSSYMPVKNKEDLDKSSTILNGNK